MTPSLETRLLGGRAITTGRVRAHAGLPHMYLGTKKEKAVGIHAWRQERQLSPMSVCLGTLPPHALKVPGDLDKERRREGRSGSDLGAGSTG
jgi:hypothetical protein